MSGETFQRDVCSKRKIDRRPITMARQFFKFTSNNSTSKSALTNCTPCSPRSPWWIEWMTRQGKNGREMKMKQKPKHSFVGGGNQNRCSVRGEEFKNCHKWFVLITYQCFHHKLTWGRLIYRGAELRVRPSRFKSSSSKPRYLLGAYAEDDGYKCIGAWLIHFIWATLKA